MDWANFIPSEFEYDDEKDKLSEHGVTIDEAIECFFHDFVVRRNRFYQARDSRRLMI
jgi:uncharacterized DUF497 family protein